MEYQIGWAEVTQIHIQSKTRIITESETRSDCPSLSQNKTVVVKKLDQKKGLEADPAKCVKLTDLFAKSYGSASPSACEK